MASGSEDGPEPVVVPGPRDVRASLDRATADGGGGGDAAACVVACPPHPRMGGSRSDRRLRAASGALVDRGIDCLRVDYGPWDGGRGERLDAERAVRWARDDDRYGAVGLFGYSFGAAVALLAAVDAAPGAVSALAPPTRLDDDGDSGPDPDPVSALGALSCPVQVVYGERDATVDSTPLVERARELGHRVEAMAVDHHLVGRHADAAELIAGFLAREL